MVNVSKSTQSDKESEIKRSWHLIDAKKQIVGRLATEIATILMGKKKTNYVSYLDSGDTVVVVNAAQLVITGSKGENKLYSRYSGYPGGLTKETYNEIMKKDPTKIIRHAVSGMLPKNKHRDQRLARLFVYKDEKHPYAAKFTIK